MVSEKNNFDFLRLLFASLVIITHSYALIGLPEIDFVSAHTNYRSSFSFIGVRGFFTISGFLIFTSYNRTSSIWSFLWKRFVRIWPALLVLLLLSALVIGALITSLSITSYFNNNSTYSYVFNNLLLLKGISYSLPGVFTNNLYPNAVNGSLWTLPYEVLFYIILCLFYFRKGININYIILPIWLICLYLKFAQVPLSGSILSVAFDKPLLMELGLYFMAGMLLSQNFALLMKPYVKEIVFVISVSLFLFFSKSPALTWLQFITIPLATISFAYLSIPFIYKAGAYGDFSYGIYIYGFLVQQFLVHITHNTIGLYNMMWIAWIITFIMGVLSWHLIEKRALVYKNVVSDFLKKRIT